MAVAVLWGGGTLTGQIAGTTALIVGTAHDATGAVLPGVAITVAGDAIMGVRAASTDAEGRFRIPALPPGDYSVSFSLDGFRPHQQRIAATPGLTLTLDIVLTAAAHTETVAVTARSAGLDRQSTVSAETFSAAELANVPGPRSMASLFEMAHGVTTSVREGISIGAPAGPTGAYGTRGANRPAIEGISVSGINSGGLGIDFGSFEQASVLTGSHGPEWATHGVHVQLVAKSGGNQYRGTLFGDYANRHWQSSNIRIDSPGSGAPGSASLSSADANRLWQYVDVNADVGGFIIRDRAWWFASVRAHQLSSRQVNFPVRAQRTTLTNYSAKSTYRAAPGHTLIGYAQTARKHQPNGLDPFGPAGSGLGSATAINTDDSSTADQRDSALIWKGEWQAVLRNQVLFELRVGRFETEGQWTPYTSAPRFEDIQTLVVSGGNRDWQSELRRDQAFGALSYFTSGRTGSHHLRIGGEAMRWNTVESWREGYPGDVLHVMRGGEPIEVYLFRTPTESTVGLWTYAAHASDTWQPHRRVTLNLGLRFDGYRVFLPAQSHPAGSPTAQHFTAVDNLIDWHGVVPRLGVVFDLTGTGTTLVKGTFARYRVAPGNNVGVNANPNAAQWWIRNVWTDDDGSGVWEPGEEGRELNRRGGSKAESLDPNLHLSSVSEAGGWLERELPGAVALRTGVVWRGERDHFARQNMSQPFEAFTVPVSILDPGPDAVVGTADDGWLQAYDLAPQYAGLTSDNVVRNVPGSRSDYWTWEISAARRWRGRWEFAAGFSHTWSADQAAAYGGQSVRNNVYPVTPNDLINTGPGGRHEFTSWTAKAHATYAMPGDVRVSPMVRHRAGQPFGRTLSARLQQYGTVTLLTEPVGTRRTDHVTIADLRLEKGFGIPGGRRLAAFVDVLNLLNASSEESVIWSTGGAFLQPLIVTPPRMVHIGARLDW